MRTSSLPYMRTVSATRWLIWGMERVSTAIAVPLYKSVISRVTVLMVEDGELEEWWERGGWVVRVRSCFGGDDDLENSVRALYIVLLVCN